MIIKNTSKHKLINTGHFISIFWLLLFISLQLTNCKNEKIHTNIIKNDTTTKTIDTLISCYQLDNAFLNPEKVGYLELSIKYNKFYTADTLKYFKNLRFLAIDVTKNKIDLIKLFKILSHFKYLNTLFLTTFKYTKIPEELGLLTQLEELFIIGNQIKYLPNSIGKLKKIRLLVIDSTHIDMIPNSIGEMKSLQAILIMNSKLSALPISISKLKNLKMINLNFNNLKDIPKGIGNLPKLYFMDLSYNSPYLNLKNIFNILQFTKTKFVLYLAGNNIKVIPDEIGLMKNMVTFKIISDSLQKISYKIKELKNLKLFIVNTNNPYFTNSFNKELVRLTPWIRWETPIKNNYFPMYSP